MSLRVSHCVVYHLITAFFVRQYCVLLCFLLSFVSCGSCVQVLVHRFVPVDFCTGSFFPRLSSFTELPLRWRFFIPLQVSHLLSVLIMYTLDIPLSHFCNVSYYEFSLMFPTMNIHCYSLFMEIMSSFAKPF